MKLVGKWGLAPDERGPRVKMGIRPRPHSTLFHCLCRRKDHDIHCIRLEYSESEILVYYIDCPESSLLKFSVHP
jgi:hypothetical protein